VADPTRRQRLRLLDPSRLNTRGVLVFIGLLTAIIQFISASGPHDKTLEPLNAAQEIAGNLAFHGGYYGGNWVRLKGVRRPQDPPLRAFNLPGYVWYAALMWRTFPQWHRYIQIPVVILLTVSVAWFASTVGGPLLGLIAGLMATLDPFIVVHGPVWDDAVFNTALLWLLFGIAAHRWRHATVHSRWPELTLVAILATLAALTRTEAQALLVVLAACVWLLPTLRPLRLISLTAVIATVIGITAWGIRNERTLGTFLTGSTHDGITLWESNGPVARTALGLGQVDRLSENRAVMQPYWAATVSMTEPQADAYFRHQAVAYGLSHSTDVTRTAVAKLAVSISGIRPELAVADQRNVVSILDTGVLLIFALVAAGRLAVGPANSVGQNALLVLSAVLTVSIVALLLVGPAGIRYWLTLRAGTWTMAAMSVGLFFRANRQNANPEGIRTL
jgi:hypothetical protein